MKEAKQNSELENALEIVKFYHSDWEYRHKHFWNLLFKLFLTNVIITLLPFISSISGIAFDTTAVSSSLFPAVGFGITVFSVLILHGEAKRLSYVSVTRNRIIKKCFPQRFGMEEFENSASAGPKKRMAHAIVVYFGIFQIAVEGIVLYLLKYAK